MRRRWVGVVVAVLLAVAGGAGCSGGGNLPLNGTLTVFASTSLTEAFAGIKRSFETAYPALRVEVSTGPDATLVARAKAGPAPDVLAVEGPAALAGSGLAGTPVPFVRNQLVLAVPADNPKRIGRLADLARPDVKVALCADAPPCGVAATAALGAAGLTMPAGALRVDDVRAALTALTDGTVDAALIYRSDARQAGDDKVATLEFPESAGSPAVYQAVQLGSGPNPHAAETFVAYLTQPSTVDAFTALGFLPPQ